jgi:hypothetical protein
MRHHITPSADLASSTPRFLLSSPLASLAPPGPGPNLPTPLPVPPQRQAANPHSKGHLVGIRRFCMVEFLGSVNLRNLSNTHLNDSVCDNTCETQPCSAVMYIHCILTLNHYYYHFSLVSVRMGYITFQSCVFYDFIPCC